MTIERPTVGESLRHHRQAAGLSLRDLAEAVGVPFTQLSDVESGGQPSDELLRAVAGALGIDEDQILVHAGRIPPDVAAAVIAKSGRGSLEFLRAWRDGDITDHQVEVLIRKSRRHHRKP